jgi:hypothetical protein
MEVERIQRPTGLIFYRIHSDYAKVSLSVEPAEMMSLVHWLKELEDELTNDAISNRVNDEMKGM